MIVELISQYYSIGIAGFVIGLLITCTGTGGGVLVVPVLISIFGFSPINAVGTASLYSALTKVIATFEHLRIKNINFAVSNWLIVGITIGLIVTAGAVNYIKATASLEVISYLQESIRYIVIASLIAFLIIFSRKVFQKKNNNNSPTTDQKKIALKKKSLISGGFFVGNIMGISGIGGGVLIIPALAQFSNLDTKKIVGSSIYIAMLASLITSFFYSSSSSIDYKSVIAMLVGSSLAVPIGSKIIRILNQTSLQWLILSLILICIVMLSINPK